MRRTSSAQHGISKTWLTDKLDPATVIADRDEAVRESGPADESDPPIAN